MILILSNLFVLADEQELQQQAREEIMNLSYEDRTKPDALAKLPLLTSIIFETLRLYPPLSQIMNKRTASDVMLGENIFLRAGTYTGYNGLCTNRNREFWGPDADVFRPSRWGETVNDMNMMYRRATSKAAFITFHGGKRTCLGQKWALAAHRVTMSIFLTSVQWRLDSTWPRKMTPVSTCLGTAMKTVNTDQSITGWPIDAQEVEITAQTDKSWLRRNSRERYDIAVGRDFGILQLTNLYIPE